MGVIPYTKLPASADGVILIRWPDPAVQAGLLTGDTGVPFIHPQKSDRSVHVKGTFGPATVYVEGTLDPEDTGQQWDTVADQLTILLAIATADRKLRSLLENVYQSRPRVAAGDGTTSLIVTMMFVGR